MNRLIFKFRIVVCLVSVAFFTGDAVGAEVEIIDVSKPAQIVIIGSDPFITDMQDSCTPAHLRSALAAVRPDIIAVDATEQIVRSGQYYGTDIKWVVVPWAEERNIPVVPIGVEIEDYNQQVEDMLTQIRKDGLVKEYKFVEDNLYSAQKAMKKTFKAFNSAELESIWRRYHRDMQRIYKRRTPWQQWNQKIADNLVELGNKNPGKRIAVVIGAAHCYYLKDAVLDVDGLTLLSIENSLDFNAATLKENFRAIDYVRSLRPLMFDNFGRLSESVLTELETRLQRLRQYPEYKNDMDFFRGKMLLHRGKSVQAVRQLVPLTYLDSKTLLEYDKTTPVRDAAMIYIAVAKIEQGDIPKGKNDLLQISQMADVKPETRDWAVRIIQQMQPYRSPEVTVDLSKVK